VLTLVNRYGRRARTCFAAFIEVFCRPRCIGAGGILGILLVLATVTPGCEPATTTSSPREYSRYELAYRVLAEYSDYFWCDPYLWPIVRTEQEESDAREQFPGIRADAGEFSAIVVHLGLPVRDNYSDTEMLLIFREHNKLSGALQVVPAGDSYDFTLRTGEGEGKRLEGTITKAGKIDVDKEERSINTCPICLVAGTMIDTPEGLVPVERLRPGMAVWTVDTAGRTVAAALLATSATPVPATFEVVRLTLADGRSVTASPGHPTATGKPLDSYKVGDALDGTPVMAVEKLVYNGGRTYDLLPDSVTGCYRAGGILLKSTLFK
jgi:hypothetical protein